MDKLEDYMEEEWRDLLKDEFAKEYYVKIEETLENTKYLPDKQNVFEFTHGIKINDINVVIVGQDPYPKREEASGLAFSTSKDYNRIPSCSRTIFSAIKKDYPEFIKPKTASLHSWVEQGVLLLNDTLTVSEGRAGSHFHLNWNKFTDKVIDEISSKTNNTVFLLFGRRACDKSRFIDENRHLIIESVHPSHYYAQKFINSKNFIKTNKYLKRKKNFEINW